MVLLIFLLESQSQDPNVPQFRETHQILPDVTTSHDSPLLPKHLSKAGHVKPNPSLNSNNATSAGEI